MGTSIRLGKILGIPIGVNYSWVFVFLLFTYLLSVQFDEVYHLRPALQRWSISVVTSVLFFLSVLAHELSHSVVAVRKGIPVRGITLFIFGGVSQLAHEAPRPLTEFLVAVVGPSVSVALGLVFLGLRYLLDGVSVPLMAMVSVLTWINLSLGVFNMLPGFPLDGGRVLRSIIWGISRSYWRATQVATRAGQLIGVFMVGGGLAMAIFMAESRFQGLWMALIGAFLVSAATASYRQERIRESLRSYRIADIMTTSWPMLSDETPLGSPLVAQALAHHDGFLAVVTGGQMVGILTKRRLTEVPRTAGPDTPVAIVMLPLSNIPQVMADDEVFSTLERMESGNLDRLAVFRDGTLVGFVDLETTLRFIRARR
jgi:Zn-dependent protease/CBS domain-containing protein